MSMNIIYILCFIVTLLLEYTHNKYAIQLKPTQYNICITSQ